MKFHYELSSKAYVKGEITIEAPTRRAADAKLRKCIGDVIWEYDGLDEDDSEVAIHGVTEGK